MQYVSLVDNQWLLIICYTIFPSLWHNRELKQYLILEWIHRSILQTVDHEDPLVVKSILRHREVFFALWNFKFQRLSRVSSLAGRTPPSPCATVQWVVQCEQYNLATVSKTFHLSCVALVYYFLGVEGFNSDSWMIKNLNGSFRDTCVWRANQPGITGTRIY